MNNSFKKTLVVSAITLSLAGCNSDGSSNQDEPAPAASPLSVKLEKHTVTRHGKIKALKATVSLTNSAGIASQMVLFKTGNGESILPHSCTLSSEKPSCTVRIHPHKVAKTTTFEATTVKTTFKGAQAKTAQANAGDAPKATAQLDGDTSSVASSVNHGGGTYLAPPILNSTGQTIQAFYIHNWADSSGNWIYGGPLGSTNGTDMNWQNGVEIAHSYDEWYDPNTVNALNWNANGYLGGTYQKDGQDAYEGETTKWTIGLLINGTCYSRIDDARDANPAANDNFQGWGPVTNDFESELEDDGDIDFKFEYGEFQAGFWGEFTSNEDGTFNFVLYSGLTRVIDYVPLPIEGEDLSSTWHLTPGPISTCQAGSVPAKPAAAYGPVGSYKKTCQNVNWQFNGGDDPWNGTLTAYCADSQGHSFLNSIQYAQACHDGSTMTNIQGHLHCDEPAHDLPPPTDLSIHTRGYAMLCAINSVKEGKVSVIDAYCPSQNAGGNMIASRVAFKGVLEEWMLDNSVSYDDNGRMSLGKSISGFQDQEPYIPGSYLDTCSNVNWLPALSSLNPYDGILSATCTGNEGIGDTVSNNFNPADVCYIGSPLSNFNGYLQCDVPAYNLPIGNWQSSCANVSLTTAGIVSGGTAYNYVMNCANPTTSQMPPTPVSVTISAPNSDPWNYYISVQPDGSISSGPVPTAPAQ